jgi:hypothetical protein
VVEMGGNHETYRRSCQRKMLSSQFRESRKDIDVYGIRLRGLAMDTTR